MTKPMPFNAQMVRAILDCRKTETRRLVKPQPPSNTHPNLFATPPSHPGDILYVPEAWKGLCSWVKGVASPRYGYAVKFKDGEETEFYFDNAERAKKWRKYLEKPKEHWQSPYFMPKEAARIFLRVTDVRMERLRDITVDGALREGTPDVEPPPICQKEISYPESFPKGFDRWDESRREEWIQSTARARYIGWCVYADRLLKEFGSIWDSTIKTVDIDTYGWAANPWVWVIQFERVSREEALSK